MRAGEQTEEMGISNATVKVGSSVTAEQAGWQAFDWLPLVSFFHPHLVRP